MSSHISTSSPWLGVGNPRSAAAVTGIMVAAAVLVMITFSQLNVLHLTQVLAFALAILGLNVTAGYTGQISLGHSAFFGLGAYAATILVTDHHLAIVATFPIVAIAGFAVGVVAGLPALRLKGHYLALVTLGFAVAFPLIVVKLGSITGGANGKLMLSSWNIPDSAPEWFNQTTVNFGVCAAVVAVGFLLCRKLSVVGPFRTLVALRENPTAAAVSGVNVTREKTISFALGAALTAVAGALFAMSTGVVAPEAFGLMLSIQLLTGLLIGGSGTLLGPILGGFVLAFLPSLSGDILGGAGANMIYGGLLIILMFVMPTGIAGGLARLRKAVARKRHPDSDGHPPTPGPAVDENTSSVSASTS
ncbi:UNVERIFIED_ORG: branched-chain amino acid transport system permease protein [Rhodococcus erythropolis]